ncbi:MAG: ATP-binding cassette domain-containing protein [Actinobacteria bacterium]|nr:ATP-binding cassette domain-containing protein [Actinomycetota bacterium]
MNFLIHGILSLPLMGAYAMFAVGIVVIYRASRVLNLAHGAMAMVPAYVVFSLVNGQTPLVVRLAFGVLAAFGAFGISRRYVERRLKGLASVLVSLAISITVGFLVFQLFHAKLPVLAALLVGVLSGAVLGLVIERIFVRGLRHMSLTAQTVGTVAVLSLLIALAAKSWGTAPRTAPEIFPHGFVPVGAGQLLYGAIGLFVTAAVLAVVMLALFKFTNLGLAMRGSAENRRAASLMGIDPDRTTAIAWAIGGALAAVSGILLAAITTLTPYDLPLQTLPAFVAALLGGIDSVVGAIGGSAAVGLLLGLVPATASLPVVGKVTGSIGGPQLTLTIAALGVMYLRGQKFSTASRDDGGFSAGGGGGAKARPKGMPWPLAIGMFLALVGWVWIPGVKYAVLANVSQALVYILIGISLVVLTGWVGQISLGHAALVGIGAFGTGIMARNFGIPFPFNLPFAAALSAGAAALLGAVALRVRGLYLAVATLIFSWMADTFLFRSSWFVGAGGSSTINNIVFGAKGGFPNFDLSDRKVLYYFGLAITALGLLAAANLRSSKTGRAFFAVRGSETAASSLGINVMRYKLLAFAISGMLAGAAGNLIIIDQRTVTADPFRFTFSLFYLSIAVIGGLVSLPGVVIAALVFGLLNYLFQTVSLFSGLLEVVSAGLLVAAILVQAHVASVKRFTSFLTSPIRKVLQPMKSLTGSLADAAGRIPNPFEKIAKQVRSKSPDEGRSKNTVKASGDSKRRSRALSALTGFGRNKQVLANGSSASVEQSASPGLNGRSDEPIVLEGRDVTVQFGGLVAVSDASIKIHKGEIVGLIGPNGAGKTTLFNSLSGLNEPTRGAVYMFGKDVSGAPVHERAKLGLGRTFQVLQLFSDLTVRENLLVATHVHNETGWLRHVAATDAAVRAESDAHRRVNEVLELLELTEIADRPAAGLPFGLLRLVELGRAVVSEAPIILLDEAASGLDNTETDRFTDFLRSLRDRMGISMLLIEHDVRMVTGVSDYMYVLNMGQMIAEGPPEKIQRDPAVIAAYLGGVQKDVESEPVGV